MLDIKFIRENKDVVAKAIQDKRVDLDLEHLLKLDEKHRSIRTELEQFQQERNQNSKKLKNRKGISEEEFQTVIQLGKDIGEKINTKKNEFQEVDVELSDLLLRVPGIPAPDVPIGEDDTFNVEVEAIGEKPHFDFELKDHVELLNLNNWAEFDRTTKVSGTRNYSLKGDGLLLEHTLIRFALEKLTKKGFDIIGVPSMAGEDAFVGTGHFPSSREDIYEVENKFLTGTSEVILNYLHAGEMLEEKNLPILYGGYSTCFRREAGSAGKDTKGLIRIHQFTKVEQFVICKNSDEESAKWHQTILNNSREIIEELGLPYRVLEVCTGDMGAGKYKMHDLECWLPSQERYLETHSCSSLHSWQARRSNLRYRDENKKPQFCHTLNNTAIACPRILAPFLETHQNADGSINLPEVLRPFFGGASTLRGK